MIDRCRDPESLTLYMLYCITSLFLYYFYNPVLISTSQTRHTSRRSYTNLDGLLNNVRQLYYLIT